MKGKLKYKPVSVIIPVYNVEAIVEDVLHSVVKQNFPIKEIIIIDNKSTDNSVDIITKFKKKYNVKKLKIIVRDKTYGISSSYNLGAKLAKSEYFVTLHSDSVLPTKNELKKLVLPALEDDSIVATFPLVVHPKDIWSQYNFWQKCLFASVMGTEKPSMNGKFDCYKKKAFLAIGGYDEKIFSHFLGTEDADMHHRLEKAGKVLATDARVVHVHSKDKNYSLKDWINRRKFLSVSYGAYIRMHVKDIKLNLILFTIKPLIVLSSFFVLVNIFFAIPIVVLPFVYMRKMFTSSVTLTDSRILILPFIIIFLTYYETFWMMKSLLFKVTKL